VDLLYIYLKNLIFKSRNGNVGNSSYGFYLPLYKLIIRTIKCSSNIMLKFQKHISSTYSHLFAGKKKKNFNDASFCRIITVIMTIVWIVSWRGILVCRVCKELMTSNKKNREKEIQTYQKNTRPVFPKHRFPTPYVHWHYSSCLIFIFARNFLCNINFVCFKLVGI
jgi:hypothetical protein